MGHHLCRHDSALASILVALPGPGGGTPDSCCHMEQPLTQAWKTEHMNEIIILPDGSRTISGEVAHILASHSSWKAIEEQTEAGRFFVYEQPQETGGEWVLRAAQSTVRLAASYMSPDRVLVYRH